MVINFDAILGERMLVFVACIKHPDNSKSYDDVWRLLNNTLFSVCSQQDTDFRVIVVCDKELPLYHHADFINQYTDFIEVDFPSHSEDVLRDFDRLGNLEPCLESPGRWMRWEENDFAKGRPVGYFHIANVFLNMGTKLLVGILAAEKYNPGYVAIFDGDDYLSKDISAYANSQPEANGWIMTHGYKLAGNKVAPSYAGDSFCGTGNIINYEITKKFISEKISETSTQNELFEYVDSEFLITIAHHRKFKPYFGERGFPLLDFPTRSVLYQVAHAESSEHAMKILRGTTKQRFNQSNRYGRIRHLSAPLIDYFSVLANSSKKVFCLGFHKTGTTSLEILLQDMGYQVASPYKNWDTVLTEMFKNGDLSELKRVAELFDAFQDAPWFLYYKEFDRLYPGSKFILTTRNNGSWWKSFLNYFKNEHSPLFRYIYGFDNPVDHEKVYVERFEKHNQEVLEYFKDRPDDLLIINISEENALSKVSAFLDRSSSYSAMPHANASRRSPISQRIDLDTWKVRVRKLLKTGRNGLSLLLTQKEFYKAPIILGGSIGAGVELVLSFLSSHPHIHTMRNVKLNAPKHHPLSQEIHRNLISSARGHKSASPLDLVSLKKSLFRNKVSFSARYWASTHRLSILVYQELLDYYGKDLRIINVVRDGRDVVVENHSGIMRRYATTPERWVFDVKEGMRFEEHPQVLTIRYEDLTQNYEETINNVAQFIGEENVAPFHNYPKGAKIITPKYWIGKWKQPQYMHRIESFLQTPGALECLRHYGYLE